MGKSFVQEIKRTLTFFTVIILSSCASTKIRIDKTPLEKHFKENHVFSESHTGLLVYDLEGEKVIFDHNSHKHFTPASNTKLLTYFASLKLMEDSIPSIEYCISNDTLYFTGTGDPTLLYPNFEYGKTIHYLKDHDGQLAYIKKPMDDERFGPGWSWDDYPYYYSAEKASFPVYGNMAYFEKDIADDYIKVIPYHFEKSLSIIQEHKVDKPSIHRSEFKNEFEFKFNTIPLQIDEKIPFIYSDDLFIKLLSDTLGKQIFHRTQFPDCDTQVLYSVPTDSIAKHILMESDNFLAEQMLLLISNQFSDTLCSKKTIEFMMKNHFKDFENQIHWVDGSGLSIYNKVTPNAMVSILKETLNEIPKEKLYDLLPESGTSGTLQNYFLNLKEKIHAKTGSLSHVFNLSGYLETNSGKTLLFSFMNNNFDVSNSELKEEMEKVLSVFVNKY